jgi:hypothetical protein
MCLVRSTQAVALAGQEWRSNAVSASEVGWVAGVSGWAALPGDRGIAVVVFWEWRMNAVVCGALEPEEAMAAPITTAKDPVATVSKAARRRAERRLLAWAVCVLFGPRGACLLLAARNVTTPGPLVAQTRAPDYLQLSHLAGFSWEIRERGGRRVGRVRSGENWRRG